MNARQEILDRIRAALAPAAGGATPPPPTGDAGSAPPMAGPEVPDLAVLFRERVSDYRAAVHECDAGGLAALVASLLTDSRAVVAPADLPAGWLSAYGGEIRHDAAAARLGPADLDADGVTVVTGCATAIAETGTIILDGGTGQGRRALTLVPDHHVCVVRADQIEPSVPAALARLPDPARPVTLISGPSATSDIELNRVEGVHGPRRLDVILVRDGGD